MAILTATEIFRGAIPADRVYSIRHDMWVMGDGASVVIGATAFGIFRAGGNVVAFMAKPKGAVVGRGRGLGTIESAKTVMAVHAPLSFVLEAPNEQAAGRPQLITDDPYGIGWMACGRPLAWAEESLELVDATVYATHVRTMEREARRSLAP